MTSSPRSSLAFVPRSRSTDAAEIPHTRPLPNLANVAAILSEHGTGRFKLRDLTQGSVRVNGQAIGEAEVDVSEGDRLDVGAYVLELRKKTGAASRASAPVCERIGELCAWSPAMRTVLARVRRVAATELPVLLTGPSGSGKEVVASAIHAVSERASGPFLAINCGALSATLIESELFGHVKGAFTGATETKEGAFEACNDGTIFLDEIGELPLPLQPKLLRVLEAHAVRKVGGTRELPVNVRIVAATHRNLRDLVERGLFREDLYHRLRVLDVAIPALADRPEDILAFARHFLSKAAPGVELSVDAEQALLSYDWPGNVRELRNVILRASVLIDGDTITAADLELEARGPAPATTRAAAPESSLREEMPLTVRADEQREIFIRVLRECGNNRAEAARRLGVSRSTFHAQLRRVGIALKFDRGE